MNTPVSYTHLNKTLGFVFQSFHLINSLNVIDNVELPLLYRKMPAKERTRLAKEVLERVGPVSYTHLVHVVRSGDSMYSIAHKY